MKNEFLSWLSRETLTKAPPGSPFILASGQSSDYYLNLKPVLMNEKFLRNVIPWMHNQVFIKKYKLVSGMETAAIPLISAVCTFNSGRGYSGWTISNHVTNLEGFFVRKNSKDHGTKKLIEYNKPLSGQSILLLEDVVTTGGSSLAAAKILRDAGAVVTEVVSVVDRGGSAELFDEHGITLTSMFTGDDLLTA